VSQTDSLTSTAPDTSEMSARSRSGAKAASPAARRQLGWWLVGMSALLFIMVVIGGATRLTDSGLSITEWRPVTGTIPPLTEEAWQAEKEKYRQIPEYQLINKGMSMAEFKYIYYWEWGHRFFGRLIGLAFAGGFLYFLLTRKIERRSMPRLGVMFALGGLQGAVGWWMVTSGLVDRVDVSQYRLVTHLGLAFIIFALMLWTSFSFLRGGQIDGRGMAPIVGDGSARPELKNAAYAGIAFAGLIYLQILLGGFVAGLKAGFSFNTWPLMDGWLWPNGMFVMSPWWLNFFENVATVQFTHRTTAYIAVIAVAAMMIWARRAVWPEALRKGVNMLGAVVLLQVIFGIITLLNIGADKPITVWLGAIHQAGAVITFGAALFFAHRAYHAWQGVRPALPAPSGARAASQA